MTGTAAWLHDRLERGERAPDVVIDLDMISQDPSRCGGHITVERSPDHVPSVAAALIEWCLDQAPGALQSYTGAVTFPGAVWQSVPFAGASDHLLFADRQVARPVVQVGHWPDRFNHSSADTMDKGDPAELKRVATAAGATAAFLASAGPTSEFGAPSFDHAARVVATSGLRRLGAIARDAHGSDPSGIVDPLGHARVSGYLARAGQVCVAELAALEEAFGRPGDAASWRHVIDHSVDALRAGFPAPPEKHRRGSPALVARWVGPFNLRGLIESSGARDQRWLRSQVLGSRSSYGQAIALALAIDGRSSRSGVIERAAYSSGLAIDESFAHHFIEAAERVGWVYERPMAR